MARASSGGTGACTPGERRCSVGREYLETFLAEARGGGGGDGVPLSSARPGGCAARVRGVRVRRGSSEARRCDTWLLGQFALFICATRRRIPMLLIRNRHLLNAATDRTFVAVAFAISGLLLGGPAYGANSIAGQVLGAGVPIANSTVTLWAATAGDPKQLAQTRTGADGRFSLGVPATTGSDSSLYLVAKGGQSSANKASGDNPAIALLAVVGTSNPPPKVAINELTTVASVWTHNQFIDGTAIKGHALGLEIAAANVPHFVDLQTGGWGTNIQDPPNSG